MLDYGSITPETAAPIERQPTKSPAGRVCTRTNPGQEHRVRPRPAADRPAREDDERTDAQRFARTANAFDTLVAAGHLREAIKLARTALATGLPRVSAARLTCALLSALYRSGRVNEAVTEAEKLLMEPDLPEDVYEAAEVVMLQAVTTFEDVLHTRPRTEDAEALIQARGRLDDKVVVVALSNLAHTAWGEGRVGEALELTKQAVRLTTTGPSSSHCPHPRLWLAAMLTGLRRFDEAETQLRILQEQDSRAASLGYMAYAAIHAANLHLAAGRPGAAAAEASTGLAAADFWGTELFTPWALSTLATTALRRGDLKAAARHAASSRRQWELAGHGYGHAQLIWVIAQVTAARSGPHKALPILDDLLDAPYLLRKLLLTEPAAAAWLVRTCLACKARAHAETVLAEAASLAANNTGVPTLVASAVHARGLLDRDPRALHRATETHQDPWARASAIEDFAALLADQGRTDQAVACYGKAMDGYEQAESPWDAARVRRRLRKLGRANLTRVISDYRPTTPNPDSAARFTLPLGNTGKAGVGPKLTKTVATRITCPH